MLIGYARVSTGAQRDRPELLASIDYARKGDTIVVWKMDRLARSRKQLIETVEILNSEGVGFKSLTENLDTTTPSRTLILHIFGALAQFEREMIRERTIAGLKAARAQGKKGGRPSAMNKEDILMAKVMLSDPEITARQVALKFGVSISTLYKHIPAAKSVAI